MVRKSTLLFLFLIVFSGLTFAQTFTFAPYGVSPGKVTLALKADTGSIFKYPYTGLTNVGLGTRVYLQVATTGQKLVSPTLATVAIPSTSKGAATIFGNKLKVNDSLWVFTFTPDVLGAFTIKVTDGSNTAQLQFNSATYLGVDNKGTQNVNCQTCHSSTYTSWQGTLHASMLTRGLNGVLGTHYTAACISCHTVGYDTNPTAKNNGFDDFTFVFPSTLIPTNYTTLTASYPNAMLRANIQCESCHGPASAHYGNTNNSRIAVTFDAAVCEYCHEDASHHINGEQFDVSVHATSSINESGNASCVPCHTGKGFAQVQSGVSTSDPYFDTSYSKITCQACHDPHDATNTYQLRTVSATATDNSTSVTTGGLGKICMNCHKARQTATDSYVAATSFSRFGPHHSPVTELFTGSNFYTFGKTFGQTKHAAAMNNGCLNCHMATSDTDPATGRPKLAGNHTFGMRTPTGESNMTACSPCHGYSLGSDFAQVKFFVNGGGVLDGDYDGDGVVNGFQTEIQGYVAKILAKLPAGKTPGSPLLSTIPTATWTVAQKQVLFNLYMIAEDKSWGLHNPRFTVQMLNESYKQIGGTPTVIEQTNNNLPSDYNLFQNYPNPFNPSTNIKFNLPKESNVKLTIYDALGKEVAVLVSGKLSAGTHTMQWNASSYASGVYFCRIEADNYKMTTKMLLIK